ncbi:PREDICTED: desmoplakin-like [Cyprinodon variegatus]|uniref:desmoplakin-like n=1 Tax=Cyprinodon variegatus TaxID=28743 RepID=UPI000742C34C|nr:PREDICTED: desmoplakin-like [Cyprinodon variegatus]
MSTYGSQQMLNSGRRASSKGQLPDLGGGGTYHYARSDAGHGGGYGYEFGEGYKTKSLSRSMTTKGGMMMMSSGMGSSSNGGSSPTVSIANRATQQQILCNEYLKKAEFAIQAGSGDAEHYMELAREAIEKLKYFALELRQMGQPFDGLMRNVDLYTDQLKEVHMVMSGTMQRRKSMSMSMSRRKSSGGWEESARSYNDAMAWIAQQKRLIETTAWADDPGGLEQQLINHQRFHSSIQRAPEVQRAIDEMRKLGDKPNQYALEQEWDSLQKMSNLQTEQLRETILFLEEISKEIMWVNEKEEEELMFDWSDRNIEKYIPTKQESYSQLMSALETKEKDLHKLQTKAKTLLKKAHPASDKIEAYMDTLQTQWSWLLQITMCIDTHLKENAAYCQFFREANDTHKALQNQHEIIRKTFTCNKDTSMEDLKELLKGLEREKENITDLKRQVQHLTAKSKTIVRLKPRNPQEKSSSGIIVKALTDFKQDQKVIRKDNEAILKDNSQRSKWSVTGPGGIDMLIPSVCLIVPPPNPLSISLANKNEQYYEAIMSLWNQLYINVKSLIAWHYCLMDINYVNSLTVSMLSKMRPEEYRQIMKKLETHFEEFKIMSHGSEMFADEDKRSIENQVAGAQAHYDKLVVELPTYSGHQEQIEVQQITEHQVQPQVYFIQQQPQQHQVLLLQQEQQQHQLMLLQQQQLQQQQLQQQHLQQQQLQQQQIQQQQQREQEQQQQAAAEEEARRLEEERRQAELKKQVKKETAEKEHTIKREVVKVTKTEQKRKTSSSSSASAFSSSSHLLAELHALRLRMDAAEGSLSQYVHVCFGDDGAQDCGLRIIQLESVQDDVDSMRDAYMRLRERILQELENMSDQDKAQFLRSEIGVINQRLGSLESSSSAYVLRLRAIRDMLESIERVEDIVKVHEARLTEKETTSLSPAEVIEYMDFLKKMKAELGQRRDLLASMESELSKASHWNSQMSGSFHRCDLMLSNFTEKVGLLSDRWRRIQAQIDTRLQDLQMYLPQLEHYKETNTSITEWIDATRRKQDTLQATKIESIEALQDHINNQKALNTEIKAKRETVDSVLRDNVTCVNSIKDYETDLNSYTSGLETLLNIPIKRTMLKSPSMDLNQEAIHLQTRYMELLIISGDYYKFLGQLLKNMEELKIRNTQINLLEDDLRRLREDMQERNAENKSLEEAVAQFKLQLSLSQEQLLSLEEVKQTTALQCSATKDSLDSTQSQLADLNSEVDRLKYLLAEEKRKTKLAEERYTQQQEEYQSVLGKRQKELESVNWSKIEVDKSLKNMEHENEQLRRQLTEESTKLMELQKEISKKKVTIQSLQSQYNEIVSERDILLQKLQRLELDREQMQRQEEELNRIKLSLEAEFRTKQRLQEENERVKRDLNYWKDQCDGKQSLIRQFDTDKDVLEREKKSLKSEIERLMKELRELEVTYKSKLSLLQKQLQDTTAVRQTMETELKRTREPPTLNAPSVVFDGVRKPVTAKQLLDCRVLDKPTYNQLLTGHKTVPEVSAEKKVPLKGTGPIAGVIIESPKSPGSSNKPLCKLTFTEAKKENILPPDSIELLLDAQAATGHIIDPRTNQKLTVEEAYNQGVVDEEDRERLLAAEAAAVGYSGPGTNKPLSVFQAMKKGIIDKTTALRLLQAQESVGGILDPVLSVFLPRDTATERDLVDDNTCSALNQRPDLYLDPETEKGVTYMAMKRKCKIEPHTGLLLLPVPEKVDPSNLVFDGVRKPVTAKHLLDCRVLDKPTFKDLEYRKRTVPEVSEDIIVNLKGTGPIAGVIVNGRRKMSLTEAKKQMLLTDECADLLLEAQAATGHIIDPKANKKLTVEEACAKGIVDINDLDRLLASEAAATGYRDPSVSKPISVFEAMKKGLVEDINGLRLLQAQESVGGILDPGLSVFLPRDTAIKRRLIDKNMCQTLDQIPEDYIDPETEEPISYQALKKSCKIEAHTGLLLLPVTEKLDPSKLIFDGVRKPVSAKDLFDCGVIDKPTLSKLVKGDKTVAEVSVDKKIFLKGTGSIAGITTGSLGKFTFSEAKKQMLIPSESADLLLEAQAATGHIIDPISNQKLTVEEACARGLVDRQDQDKLLTAEAAAVGYKDPHTGKPLSIFEALKKAIIDKKTGLRFLQAQECAGGVLDPNLSVFLPKDTAMKRNLLDEDLSRALNQNPDCYLDPDTERDVSYGALKKKCKTEPHTGLMLLPLGERKDPSKLIFDGVRKPVSAQQLLECGVLDQSTFKKLIKGEKTVTEVSQDKKVNLKGTGAIAGVFSSLRGNISLTEAKKQRIISEDSADLLLEAQAATGHIVDPKTEQKLTVEVACSKGVVDFKDQARFLAAEYAAVGYKDQYSGRLIPVFEAMKKGVIDETTGLRLLQAQDSVGGILDPTLSVFLPKDTAIKRNLLDDKVIRALNQNPACYLDPESEKNISYGALKAKCNTNTHTGLHILPVSEKFDPSNLLFDGIQKTVTAQQLLDCGVLDKKTFGQLIQGKKTVSDVSVDIKIFLKGTGSIAGVAAGPLGKMSFTEAKKEKIMSSESANMLLLAQAATGHIIDPRSNKKLTVKEACAKGLVDKEDEPMLFAAEAAAIGYRDPGTATFLSAGQAMRKGIIDKKTALRILQAQESVGGILDPSLGVFLPKDIARKRNLIDDDLHQTLNQSPECYLDPNTQQPTTYVSLKKKCKSDPSTGLLLLPKPEQQITIRGLRNEVSVIDLVDANLLNKSDVDQLNAGKLTGQDIEDRLRSYLGGSNCIAGVYDEASDKVLSIYQAMKNDILRRGTTLELLEAQAASGFMIDPVKNLFLTVAEASKTGLFGPEFKDKLLSAEKAVTGYKIPGTEQIVSLFQAIENGLVERGHGIRLLEAQIASGGIIDPQHSHRIDVDVAYKRGYFNEEMNKILTDESDDTKGFFDPNTQENLTYLELKKRCILDKNTGLVLLPIIDKKKKKKNESSQKNTVRKRRVIIVDPETDKEMTVREAYNKGYIDYDTYLELSEQECEWEEIAITAADGSIRFVITDKSTGRQFDINDLLEKKVIDQSVVEQYRSNAITIAQFADIISNKTKHETSSVTSSLSSSSSSNLTQEQPGRSSVTSSLQMSTSGTSASFSSSLGATSFPSSSSSFTSTQVSRPLSPTFTKTTTTKITTIEKSSSSKTVFEEMPDSLKQVSSVSVTLLPPLEAVGGVEPVGAIFDTETLEKVSITEAFNRGLLDSITAQRLLEAQACTGGIVNPSNGKRVSIQEASHMGIITNDMATKLKPAQKAFFGYEDMKMNRKLSAAQAMKEMWLPYEAGQRFLEFQVATGGLYDPEKGCRRSIEDARKMGWLDVRGAQKLQDIQQHTKNLTCPKSKLKISYKEVLDNCLVEEGTGVKMLQASSVSSRGISSPYNIASAPGSKTGSRSGSQRGSRRNSLDLGRSSTQYLTSFTSFSSTR